MEPSRRDTPSARTFANPRTCFSLKHQPLRISIKPSICAAPVVCVPPYMGQPVVEDQRPHGHGGTQLDLVWRKTVISCPGGWLVGDLT